MIILGVDPGLSLTGWGLISLSNKKVLSLMSYGCIKTKASVPLPERLNSIHSELVGIIRRNKPEVMAVEELYFCKQARTLAAVGQARGVILLAAEREKVKIAEYNPRHVKMALIGYGSADKNQIQQMVKRLLMMKEIPKPDDAADALALAICHINTKRF